MMMVPVRPEMIEKLDLPNARLTKAAFGVNPREPLKTDTPNASLIASEIDFPGPVRYFRSVLVEVGSISSRACFPISSDARAKGL